MSSIIILDSSDEESENKEPIRKMDILKLRSLTDTVINQDVLRTSNEGVGKYIAENKSHKQDKKSDDNSANKQKRKLSISENDSGSIKRIKPTLISKNVDQKWFQTQSPVILIDDIDNVNRVVENLQGKSIKGFSPPLPLTEEVEEGKLTEVIVSQPALVNINPVFSALLEVCRKVDSSQDMKVLIEKKLLKYYHSVHPDFVNTKSFCRTVKSVTEEIESTPDLVYYKLKTIIEELKIRRKNQQTVMCNEDVTTTGNERKDRQIKRLNRALYVLTKQIKKLEEADVDLNDDDNSSYLQVERCKKRACEIYEKICDLTGESKYAYRSVKKPISFQGTCYPQFNRTIQAFVNRTNTFPDFFDVLRCLEHCNTQYGFHLKNDDLKKIAQDAFINIGKVLQNRRKTDLYETVEHFTGNCIDPALADPNLNAKLSENQKFHSKISTIIDKYAAEQELATTEKEKNKYENIRDTERESSINSSTPIEGVLDDDKISTQINSEKDDIHVEDHIKVNGTDKTEETAKEISNSAAKTDNVKNQQSTNNINKYEEIVISDEDEL